MPHETIPRWHRFHLGDLTITPLLVATKIIETPHLIYGTNISEAEFEQVSEDAFLPTDRALNSFTPVLVETAKDCVLFDTGLSGEAIRAALLAAGKTTADITMVIITHMHGDHVGGLMTAGQPTFPNARHITGRTEWDYWSANPNDTFAQMVKPLETRFELIDGPAAPTPWVTALPAPGHTPGHMCYQLQSHGKSLILTADVANHYVWSVAHPDWTVRFDIDQLLAIETRKRILGMIADQRLPFMGYHMPFPAVGYLQRSGEGFRYCPASYQLDI